MTKFTLEVIYNLSTNYLKGGSYMKKLLHVGLTLLGTLSVLIATAAASSASTIASHQPECPKELLK
jgi:cyclic lactone autoinducer peptide